MLLTARYVLPVSSPHIEHGGVLVHDDTIAEIGAAQELKAAHPDEEVLDLGLAAIMPGLVDLHTHLEYSAMRGLVDDLPYSQWKIRVMALEELLTPEDWEDAALLGAMEAASSGITTIADITETGASARAAVAARLRAFVYREVSTMDKAQVGSVMAEAAEDMSSWRELDGSRLTIGLAPHAPYSCHPELFARITEVATADGIPVSMHLAGSRDEYDFVKYGRSLLAVDFRDRFGRREEFGWLPTGVSPVSYVLQWGLFDVPNMLAVHCTQVDENDIDILAQHGVAIAYCPRCNAKLGMGMAPLGEFIDHEIPVGIGTDSPASNNTMDMFDEMRIGLLLQRAVSGHAEFYPAKQFVRLATLGAAEALGIEDRVGSLEPGKQADIIGVEMSHTHQVPTQQPYSTLVHTANQDNVLFTMVAGDVLYERETWRTLDAERILARADEMRLKLRG